MKLWIVAYALAALCAGAHASTNTAHLEMLQFVVSHLSGQVFLWDLPLASWKSVRSGQALSENSVLEIGEDSEVTLKVPLPEGSTDAKITIPVVVRLDRDFLRKVRTSNFFMDKPPSQKEETSLLVESLKNAWERYIVVTLRELLNSKTWLSMLAKNKKRGVAAALRAGKIEGLSPRDGATFIVSRLPGKISVRWENKTGTKFNYNLRVWNSSDDADSIDLTTKDNQVNVPVRSEGAYFVQVSSSDGKYQSMIHKFQIFLPAYLNAETGRPLVSHGLKLFFPPPDFTLVIPSLPASLHFYWKTQGLNQDAESELVVSSEKGEELYHVASFHSEASLDFSKKGTYRWKVVEHPKENIEGSASKIESEERTLIIEPTTEVPLDVIKRSFASLERGTLYLENGF